VTEIQVKPYEDFKNEYNDILGAVGEYFELFNKNTDKLEDLWL